MMTRTHPYYPVELPADFRPHRIGYNRCHHRQKTLQPERSNQEHRARASLYSSSVSLEGSWQTRRRASPGPPSGTPASLPFATAACYPPVERSFTLSGNNVAHDVLRVAIWYRIVNIIPALPCTLRPDLDIVASQARAESPLSHEPSTTLSVICATTHATPHPEELCSLYDERGAGGNRSSPRYPIVFFLAKCCCQHAHGRHHALLFSIAASTGILTASSRSP
ncbi:hypothetical protein C8Q74DRAFT_167082 [Fomes fomentarius]|nr:hypothetical protein C8Q74DRAFT_167082 [Fomes fomentarius]